MNRRLDTVSRCAAGMCAGQPSPCAAQVTPAAGYTPPDDTPSIKVGATIFADYTVQQRRRSRTPTATRSHPNAFNVGRAYINVTGNISHIHRVPHHARHHARDRAPAARLNGSYTFRLKYAYAQFNLDDWMNPGRTGSWVRLGMQQTPWVDFMESDLPLPLPGHGLRRSAKASCRRRISARRSTTTCPGNYGDVHTGFYNGETYTRPEVNDQKGFMIRGTLRPLPHAARCCAGSGSAASTTRTPTSRTRERTRGIFAVTFEHKY